MSTTPPYNAVPLTSDQSAQQELLQEQKRGDHKPTSPLTSFLRGFWHIVTLNTNMKMGSTILAFFFLLAIFGPLIARYDPNALTQDSLQPPSAQHWLGTTLAGQDVFAQLMIGTRSSILYGLLAAILAALIYVSVGLSAGYFGGTIDEILTLITNVFLVIPGFPLALIVTAYIPFKSPLIVAAIVALTGWAGHARTIRAQTLTLRQRDFVEASRVSGERTIRIIFLEILPNMLAIVAAGFVGTMLGVVLSMAGLEFLGLGDIRSVSWGSMFYWAQNGQALISGAWWWFVPPGVFIALLGAGLTFVNIGIDEIADPRLRNLGRRRRKKNATV